MKPIDLSSVLLKQPFFSIENKESVLAYYKQLAISYISLDNSVAVLSDYQENCSYVYAGSFGKVLGLKKGDTFIASAFEDIIFDQIHPDDLQERHILELRFFQMQKNLTAEERDRYNTSSYLRIGKTDSEYLYINHRTFFLRSLSNGSTWLSMCLYAPAIDQSPKEGIDGKIINNYTGEILPVAAYKKYDTTLLSRRELDVISLIAKGYSSRQIGEKLYISTYTVNRHRQNILKKMQTVNAAQAVKTAIQMKLIPPS